MINKILMVITLGILLSGFIPGSVEETTVKVTAGHGDTVWELCERHYDKNEVRCFENFVYDVRKENNLLGNNVLQAGQEVVIRVRKK